MEALKQLEKNKGFTLIELLISVCIMAIAFAGLATMQVACINGNSIASNLTSGITLAQDKMEQLHSLDYNEQELADNNTSNNNNLQNDTNFDHRELHVNVDGNVDQTASPPAGFIYTRIWNVADDTPVNGRKTVVVIVTWKNHLVTVSSVIGAPYS